MTLTELGGQTFTTSTPEPSLVETDKGNLVVDPMSTLETNGDAIGSDMSKAADNSTIKLGGMEMTLANAMNLGFMKKDASGNYSMTEDGEHFHITRSEQQMAAYEQAQQDRSEFAPVSREAAQHAQQLSHRAGPAFINSIGECAEAMLNQDYDGYQRTVHELESAAQAQGLDGFMEAYIMEANDSLKEGIEASFGISGDDLEAFASENIPAKEMGKLIAGWAQGDRSVLQYIENNYMDKFRSWKARKA